MAAPALSSPNARPIATPADFARNHVISIQQFTSPAAVAFLCDVSELMAAIVTRRGGCDLLQRRVLANVFYEPSTRTSCSFASAMQRLGGSVLQVNESTSSAAKGETLGDSVRALACYADAVVLRHPARGSAAEGSTACPVPLLNAGDGVGEHPTQALLDFACIRQELGRVAGLTVTLVGDLTNGRTVHSLARLLALCGVGKINYVAPRASAARAGARGRAGGAQRLSQPLCLCALPFCPPPSRSRAADARVHSRRGRGARRAQRVL
jgi:carbamoyl-phosphate synthase/aspartate carbamoyltransferase